MNKFIEDDITVLQMHITYCEAKNLLEELNDDFFEYGGKIDPKRLSAITEEETRNLLEPVGHKCQMLLEKISEMASLYNSFHGIENVTTENFEENPEEEKETMFTCMLIL